MTSLGGCMARITTQPPPAEVPCEAQQRANAALERKRTRESTTFFAAALSAMAASARVRASARHRATSLELMVRTRTPFCTETVRWREADSIVAP
jgi:hypothetical protein